MKGPDNARIHKINKAQPEAWAIALDHREIAAVGGEARLGRVAPGEPADLIVLEKDHLTCDPDEMKDLCSSATMVGGEWVLRT